ncbi:MAG: DUF167 domain-containing protein [Methanoregula sp.]
MKNGSTPLVIHVRYCRATFLFTVIRLPDISGAVSEERQGVVISLEVTAGAKVAVFPSGYNEWRRSIGCRVSAPALEGRANKAVIRLVAEKLDVPASSVSIASGSTSSQKRVLVGGMSREQVLNHLQ